MKNFKRILLTITIVLSVFQIYSKSTTEIGTLPGSVGVAPNGAATYTIPIELPQGRGNMTPSIALNYNSLSGQGILGKGWGLSGWSYIERVAETKYHDGQIGIMDFNNTDGLLLDGNRLIKGDNYYRTEIDNFARITSTNYGKEKEGKSSYFTAVHANGITKYYGSNDMAESRQYFGANVNIPIRWHLDVVEDRFGNKIKYYYDRNTANGELYIKEIQYDFDYNNPDNAYYKVAFVYEDLAPNHISSNFYAHQYQEYRFDIRKRLIGINVLNSKEEVLTSYTITYEKNGMLEEEVVKEVSVSANGSSYPPTRFSWNSFDFTHQQKNALAYQACYGSTVNISTGDFNGDGISDLVESERESMDNCAAGTYIRINNGSLQIRQFVSQAVGKHYSADFDGDGKDELLIAQNTGYKLFKFLSGATSLQIIEIASSQTDNIESIGDFNGDMIMDVIIKKSTSSYKYHPGIPDNINGLLSATNAYTINGFDLLEEYKTGNFIGSGITTFLKQVTTNGSTSVSLYNLVQSGTVYVLEALSQNETLIAMTELISLDIADFNADNKDDLLVTSKTIDNQVRRVSILYSNGTSFTQKYHTNISTDTAWYSGQFMVGDINNDGRADIYTLKNYSLYGNTFKLSYSTYFKYASVETGFKTYSSQATFYIDNPGVPPLFFQTQLLIGDFNGQGINSIFALQRIRFKLLPSDRDQKDSKKEDLYTDYNGLIIANTTSNGNYIHSVNNGLERKQRITYTTYDPLSYENTKDYPVLGLRKKYTVVKAVENGMPDGVNFYPATTYQFKGMMLHAEGKGVLGFQEIITYNKLSEIKTTTYNDLLTVSGTKNNSLYFMPYTKQTETVHETTKQLLSFTENTMAAKQTFADNPLVYLPVITQAYTKSFDLNGAYIGLELHEQQLNQVDNFGNSLLYKIKKSETAQSPVFYDWTHEKQVFSTFKTPTAANWINYKENELTKSKIKGDAVWKQRRTILTRDDNGLVLFQRYIPNESYGSPLVKLTEYQYDAHGNLIWTQISAPNNPATISRSIAYEHTTDKRFLHKTISQAQSGDDITEQFVYDPDYRWLLQTTNSAGMSTSYKYTAFGKLMASFNPDETIGIVENKWVEKDDDAPINAIYAITTYLQGGANAYNKETVYYNNEGKSLRAVMYNLQGQKVFIDQYYNEDGRLESVSEPYFAITSKPALYTYYKYDPIGRLVAQINPDGTEIETEYNGSTVRVTNNATSVYKQTQYNIIGKPKTVTDRIGSINYSYNANGQPVTIDALGNLTEIDYDEAGNRASITEPNTGTKTYTYNAFGEIIEQKDQKNNTYQVFYDEFGRLTKREETTGTFDEINYTYYRSSSQYGFGQVAAITRTNGEHVRYTYDQLGRIIAKSETSPAKFFNFAYSYNKENGMLETLTYPTGFKLIYTYALNGKVSEVIRGSDKRLLWKADTENERMQLTSYHSGNGVHEFKSFDDYGLLMENYAISTWRDVPLDIQRQQYHFETSTGNLLYRKDLLNGQTEEFDYDQLLRNRLTAAGPRQAVVDIQYQDNGNIYNKSDVTRRSGSYNYEDSRINAVSSITLPTDAYVADFEIIDLTYTHFDKASAINGLTQGSLNLSYGVFDQRTMAIKTTPEKPNQEEIKLYSDHYEVEIDHLSQQKHFHYLAGGDGVFGVMIQQHDGTQQMYYLHKDHLGSYTTITDDSGNTIERMSYDAWGRRRNPDNWADYQVPQPMLDRGYTGHEHLDQFNLINMNGRIYDPVLARFLSPDPFVQDPSATQNYNRYTYAMNNPLKYTDPSGYTYKPAYWNVGINGAFYVNHYANSGPTGLIGPGSGNHWSDPYRTENGNWMLGNHASFDGIYGEGAFDSYYNQHYTQQTSENTISNGDVSNNNELSTAWVQLGFFYYDTNGNPIVGKDGTYGQFWVYEASVIDEAQVVGKDKNNGITMQEAAIGVGAFSLANGIKGNLVEWGMKGADWGKAGARYVKYVKRAGILGFVVNVGISGYGSYDYYYNQNGTDWQVGAKATLDVAMGAAAFIWPIGTAISGAYFILDVSTGGFSGWGDPNKP
ncbi:MAG: VCBS repeat-containing protein [Bacteroidetes bacterium]|nr:VCBS repeat-containing protein [Bacteroidota bacterium]MBU2558376.1 VCBS repeat-containing protein [Bacteroidota bacterium]